MDNSEISGCKALVASIINQAISDCLLYKHPRNPKLRPQKGSKHIKLIVLVDRCVEIVSNYYLYSNQYISFCIDFLLKYIKNASKKMTCINEELSYDARDFISHTNKLFYLYFSYIDIDPIYFETKFKKELIKYDNGQSSIFSTIDKKEYLSA